MANDSYFTPEQLKLLARVAAGGGLLGVGVGGGAALMGYLKRLTENKTSKDDDVLYVYKDQDQIKSSAAKQAGILEDAVRGTISFGKSTADALGAGWRGVTHAGEKLNELAASAGEMVSDPGAAVRNPLAASAATVTAVAAALGGYSLARKVESAIRKRQAQKELDDAQVAFLDAQGYKRASAGASGTNFSGGTWLASAVPTTLALLALASAATTYGYLDSKNPIEKKLPKKPRRIEIVDKPDNDVAEYDAPDADYNKMAAARECVLYMLDADGDTTSDIRNLISAVANNGTTEFRKAANAIGFFDAMNLVKGASMQPTHPEARLAAITFLAKSASFAPQIDVIAAGEFATKYPRMYKSAAALDEDTRNALIGIASVFGPAVRAERAVELGIITDDMDKSASIKESAADVDMIEKMLNQQAMGKRKPVTKGDNDESTGTSGEEAGISDPDSPSRPHDKRQFIMSGTTGRNHIDSNKTDIIDEFLNPSKKETEPSSESDEHGKGFISPII